MRRFEIRIYEQEEYFNSPQTRMAYIFWQLMDAKKPYLIDDLSEEMKVGRTTTVGDLNRIREQIKKYDLTVEGKANTGLSLCGEEIKSACFFWKMSMSRFISTIRWAAG